jgi:hypothetical protein
MSGSPLDPLVHLLTSLAQTIGAAAVVTVSGVAFLRWLGLHWDVDAARPAARAMLWSFDQEAAGFAAATAVFAWPRALAGTRTTSARRDRAQDARPLPMGGRNSCGGCSPGRAM